jgi:hypothetical protein
LLSPKPSHRSCREPRADGTGGLDEEVGGYMEEGGSFFGLGFADGALGVEDFGGDAF